jgi:hypothetical protein
MTERSSPRIQIDYVGTTTDIDVERCPSKAEKFNKDVVAENGDVDEERCR